MITTENPGPATRTGTAQGTAVCTATAVAQSVATLRLFARDVATHWQLPEAVGEALCLVVSELVTNVVLHSRSPHVTLSLTRDDLGVTARVSDNGQWKTRTTRRIVEADADAACGRGLQLVAAYATAWTRLTTAAGTRVTAQFAM